MVLANLKTREQNIIMRYLHVVASNSGSEESEAGVSFVSTAQLG